MEIQDCDLFVIGGGSGGVRAARVAGKHGARVVIAEAYRYGGTCVIRGCIPKKLMVYASHFARDFADAAGYGWTVDATLDWAALRDNVQAEVSRLSGIYGRLLDEAGVEALEGRARLVDAHTVEVGERRFRAKTILVAVGGQPVMPSFRGAELAISSNEFFTMPQLPRQAVVAGGGYIAVELAHVLAGLGVDTALVHRRDRVLRGFDDDIRTAATEGLEAAEVTLHMEDTIHRIEADGDRRRVVLGGGVALDCDLVLAALGRMPLTGGMGLEAAGVRLEEHGAVIVDEMSRSSVEHIYAVGDCTGRVQLTPAAIREGQAFADSVFGGTPTPVVHDRVPSAVFAQPAIATVGLTEEQARERFGEVAVYEARFRPLKASVAKRRERMYMKVLVDAATDRVVGAHMVSEDAPEIIQLVAVAMEAAVTKAHLDRTLAIHPTTAEELVLMRTRSR